MSEHAVMLELLRRGWHVLTPVSRDAPYDLVIDRGNGIFETIQVKTMSGRSITKFVDRSGEVVAKNGKMRNSIDYAEMGISWLAGYDKSAGQCYFYKLETYSKIPTKTFSTNKYPQDDFPYYEVPNRHAKKKVA